MASHRCLFRLVPSGTSGKSQDSRQPKMGQRMAAVEVQRADSEGMRTIHKEPEVYERGRAEG